MMPLNQDSAGNFITRLPQTIMNIKEGTQQSIEAIGNLSTMILNAIDWVKVIFNKAVIFTFIDQMTIVVVLALIVLKIIGFKDLEKWILLAILIKVIVMVLI